MDGKIRTVNKRWKCDRDLAMYDISAYNDTFAAVTSPNVEIWNYFTGYRLHSILHEDPEFMRAAISDELIVIGTMRSKIYVRHTSSEPPTHRVSVCRRSEAVSQPTPSNWSDGW